MLQKSGRLVLWEAMFILELHSAETQGYIRMTIILKPLSFNPKTVFNKDFSAPYNNDECEKKIIFIQKILSKLIQSYLFR